MFCSLTKRLPRRLTQMNEGPTGKARIEKSFSGSRVYMEVIEMTLSMCHRLAPTSWTMRMPSPVLKRQPSNLKG